MPMLKRYPMLAGALVGLALRLIFSGAGGTNWSAMAGAFIYAAPFVVGMVTVYLAERQRRRSWTYYMIAPVRSRPCCSSSAHCCILIEGWICAIIIIPMFAILGAWAGS